MKANPHRPRGAAQTAHQPKNSQGAQAPKASEDEDYSSESSDESSSSFEGLPAITPMAKGAKPSKDPNIVEVGGLRIDIERITDQEMYSLRKVLPRKEYRLLKNRKSARKSRKRRKAELSSLRDEIRALRQENQRLRALVAPEEPKPRKRQKKDAGMLHVQEADNRNSAFAPVPGALQAQEELRQRLLNPPPPIPQPIPKNPGCYSNETWCPSMFNKPYPMNPFAQLISLPHTLLQQLTAASHMRQMQPFNQAEFTAAGAFTQQRAMPSAPLTCQTLTSRLTGLFQQEEPPK